MSSSVVTALIGFGATLQDNSVEAKTKLHVLSTLNEVPLTLSELSESGVGRAVSKLKSSPGELGSTARLLVTKWKRLLRAHMVKEDVQIPRDIENKNRSYSPEKRFVGESKSTNVTPHHSKLSENSHTHVASTSTCSSQAKYDPTEEVPSSSIRPQSFMTENSSPLPSTSSDRQYKNVTKRKSSKCVESLDSSSGLSFMESLMIGSSTQPHKKPKKSKLSKNNVHQFSDIGHQPHQKYALPPKPSSTFRAEILSSLSEDVDRPDVIHSSNSFSNIRNSAGDDDDGDLKFKSKKVLWVPKASRNGHTSSCKSDPLLDDAESLTEPPTLIELCLNVLQQNLNRLDYVGHVPYDLLARVLCHASPEDLMRIENCNPHYVGCTDDLWQRHVQRDFRHRAGDLPHRDETWCSFYQRLSNEENKRLNRIISKSAKRIKEEQENRRTTLTTEVITPRQVQRRASRQTTHQTNRPSKTHDGTKQLSNETSLVFRPYNVSKPTAQTMSRNPISKEPIVSDALSAKNTGGLLNKLRKQFRSGRLR